jgi:hypothetical protein
MAVLEQIGRIILALAGVGFVVYLRVLSMKDMESRRQHKSGLQGFFKKID